ncbi:uncharacterized protein LOC114332547 [Diabrotica virgifera virgifera]|uniref:Homologous recombination OB-fold protein OB-fold domain-containing protein n=1 Tax=Diabrotica virgifera virgifera TaxID=50390 RepID=A0ABM5IPJ5_DIAVI|nr:uncharacterized protein LOC114332547 [Diabrotica virgifera virgifera]
MFESGTSFGDDDLELETSFTPIFSSTQNKLNEKRKNEVFAEKNSKKVKTHHNTAASFIKNPALAKATKENSFSPNKVVKRMFPGPAGLLPDDIGKKTMITSRSSNDDSEEFFFCSQRSVSTFTEGPWKLMTEDFSSCNDEQLYNKFTISWIKKKYCQKRVLDNYKAPFLAAIIQNLEIVDGKNPSVHITLKDTTGTIDGVIIHRFYKDHSKYFTTGSVVVLKQFGVLNSNERHCITITSKNVLVIYHIRDPNKEDADNTEIKEPFEKVVLQHYNIEDIWKEANSNVAKVSKNNKNLLKNINNTPYGKNKSSSHNISRGINISPQNNASLSNMRHNIQQSSCSNFLLPNINHISTHNQNRNNMPENFSLEKGIAQHESKKKFDFKKVGTDVSPTKPTNAENVVISCSEMSVTADKKDSEIWKSVLEDVDSESLFGDF